MATYFTLPQGMFFSISNWTVTLELVGTSLYSDIDFFEDEDYDVLNLMKCFDLDMYGNESGVIYACFLLWFFFMWSL